MLQPEQLCRAIEPKGIFDTSHLFRIFFLDADQSTLHKPRLDIPKIIHTCKPSFDVPDDPVLSAPTEPGADVPVPPLPPVAAALPVTATPVAPVACTFFPL